MQYLIITIIIITIIYYLKKYYNYYCLENYNDEVGIYCQKCNTNNTINKCLVCSNCVWIKGVGCVPGSHLGPYNKKIKNKWYSGDPITYYY